MLGANTSIYFWGDTIIPITVVQRWKGKAFVGLDEVIYKVSLKDEQEFERQG